MRIDEDIKLVKAFLKDLKKKEINPKLTIAEIINIAQRYNNYFVNIDLLLNMSLVSEYKVIQHEDGSWGLIVHLMLHFREFVITITVNEKRKLIAMHVGTGVAR